VVVRGQQVLDRAVGQMPRADARFLGVVEERRSQDRDASRPQDPNDFIK